MPSRATTLAPPTDVLLAATGRHLDTIEAPLTTEKLAGLDQFHVRGLRATRELAELAGVASGQNVLDAGSGLGGPARYLAETFDCRIEGVDLSPTFVAAANLIAERCGLSDRVRFEVGDLLDLLSRLPNALAARNLSSRTTSAANAGWMLSSSSPWLTLSMRIRSRH